MKTMCKLLLVGVLAVSFGWCSTAQALHITGVTVTGPATAGSRPWTNLVNDSGMSDDLTRNATNADATIHWSIGAGGVSTAPFPVIDFDLGASYLLDEMRIWNYGETGDTTQGIRGAFIDVSNDNVNFTTIYNTFGADPDITQNDGSGANTVDAIVDLSGAGSIRYVKIKAQSNWGPFAGMGLGEVRFYEIPEPTTMALLGLGGLAALRRRRRQA